MSRTHRSILFLSLAAFAVAGTSLLFSASDAQAQAKQPPSCAAITFRPLEAGTTGDGEHEAGLYKSRFGRITVVGAVKSGQVDNYFMTVNGKRPAPAGALPPSVASCASQKKLPAPGTALSQCVGDRLQVLIDRNGDKRTVALYARSGGRWQFCSAGTA